MSDQATTDRAVAVLLELAEDASGVDAETRLAAASTLLGHTEQVAMHKHFAEADAQKTES